MPAPQDTQQLYEELAEHCARRHDHEQRDVFLVLAADTALSQGQLEQAERLRQRLVQLSPHTLLKPYVSFAEAVKSSDIREYVADLRHQFPLETATKLLVDWRLGDGVLSGSSSHEETARKPAESFDLFPRNPAPSTPVPPSFVFPKPPVKTKPSRPGSAETPSKKHKQRPNEETKGPLDEDRPLKNKPKSQGMLGQLIVYILTTAVVLLALAIVAIVFVRPFVHFNLPWGQ